MYQVSIYEDLCKIEIKRVYSKEKYSGLCYHFSDDRGYGKFAIGKTKEEALSIILNCYQEEIRKARETILNCENNINNLNGKSAVEKTATVNERISQICNV